MKRICLILILCFMFCIFVLPCHAQGTSASSSLLSPALQVLADNASFSAYAVTGKDVVFPEEKFDSLFGLKADSIQIVGLPSSVDGTLALGSVAVLTGQTILREDWQSLRFIPNTDCTFSCFTFTSESLPYPYRATAQMYVLEQENTAPCCAESNSGFCRIYTVCGICYRGKLSATDAENDEMTFSFTSRAENGVLRMTDCHSGTYTYTPNDGFSGDDSFTYTATDRYGNRAIAQTVTVHVAENDGNITFCDMASDSAHAAAIQMVRKGIMQTRLQDGMLLFCPEETVTRGEFIKMAMQTAGYEVKGYKITAYEDDATIPKEQRGYVAAALDLGYLPPISQVNNRFDSSLGITEGEAAVILYRMGLLKGNSALPASAVSESSPTEEQCVSVMREMGYVPALSPENADGTKTLTRSQTALILSYMQ